MCNKGEDFGRVTCILVSKWGFTRVHVNDPGQSLSFRLHVANIPNICQRKPRLNNVAGGDGEI